MIVKLSMYTIINEPPPIPYMSWTQEGAGAAWLRSQGFDLTKPIKVHQDLITGDFVYEQEGDAMDNQEKDATDNTFIYTIGQKVWVKDGNPHQLGTVKDLAIKHGLNMYLIHCRKWKLDTWIAEGNLEEYVSIVEDV